MFILGPTAERKNNLEREWFVVKYFKFGCGLGLSLFLGFVALCICVGLAKDTTKTEPSTKMAITTLQPISPDTIYIGTWGRRVLSVDNEWENEYMILEADHVYLDVSFGTARSGDLAGNWSRNDTGVTTKTKIGLPCYLEISSENGGLSLYYIDSYTNRWGRTVKTGRNLLSQKYTKISTDPFILWKTRDGKYLDINGPIESSWEGTTTAAMMEEEVRRVQQKMQDGH